MNRKFIRKLVLKVTNGGVGRGLHNGSNAFIIWLNRFLSRWGGLGRNINFYFSPIDLFLALLDARSHPGNEILYYTLISLALITPNRIEIRVEARPPRSAVSWGSQLTAF
jgi:hypothetical protein